MEQQKELTDEEMQRTNKILMYAAELLQREGLITVDERVRMAEALCDEI